MTEGCLVFPEIRFDDAPIRIGMPVKVRFVRRGPRMIAPFVPTGVFP